MRLKNTTTIPPDVVRAIVRFTCPPGVAGYDVKVAPLRSRGGTVKGRAYSRGSSYHATAAPFVNLYVREPGHFPCPPKPPCRPGYLPMPYFASRVEALVYLAAHELRHLWQATHPRGRRVWGARGQFSERDADAYAIRLLRAWRRR